VSNASGYGLANLAPHHVEAGHRNIQRSRRSENWVSSLSSPRDWRPRSLGL